MADHRCWAYGIVLLGAVGAVGCDSGDTATGGTAGTGGTGGTGGAGGGSVCPEDPATGPVAEECGIWVSVGKGDDTNEGTQAAPVASLMHAIDLAAKGAGRVYACSETWAETLVVPSGVSLHGGFDCESGWAYVGSTARSMVAAPDTIALTWIDSGDTTVSVLSDFSIEAPDAVEPSDSSIAAFVRDDVELHVYRSEFIAGDGADGLDGAPGDANDEPAAAGAQGNDGADACSAAMSEGGIAVENVCSSGTSKGGAGGDSGPMIAESGEAGEPVGDPPGGAGGMGQQLAPACTAGGPGSPGVEGEFGLGGGYNPFGGIGRLTKAGFVGRAGDDGKSGLPGQGGGGGGATYGSAAVCGAATPGGAAGGSGGAGGCGGKGGGAGQPGGASIAFATLGDDSVKFWDIVVWTGIGGDGGDGGLPQLGGAGGTGGAGGKGAGSIPPACAGGMGGSGGTGGMGGGGMGGLSSPIVSLRVAGPNSYGSIERHYGMGGKGGKGAPGSNYSYGADGLTNGDVVLDP